MGNFKEIEREVESQSIVFSTVFGTLFHWYGFYCLGNLLNFIIDFHYPDYTKSSSQFLLIAFLMGFFIRPLGSIFISPYIDIKGRKKLFGLSLGLIASSLLITLIFPFSFFPPEVGIGILMIARLIQGVAISIEYGSALTYIYETVRKKRVGLAIGLLQTTPPLGFAASQIIFFISTFMFQEDEVFNSFQWRFPLLLGLIIYVITIFMRSGLAESAQFELLEKRNQILTNPLSAFLKETPRFDLWYSFFGVTLVQGVLYYLFFGFLKSYYSKMFMFSTDNVSFFFTAMIVLVWPVILLFGRLTDFYCAKKLYFIGLLYNLIILIMLKPLLDRVIQMNAVTVWSGFFPILLVCIGVLGIYAFSGRLLADLFPVEFRGTGISIPYHVGNGIFGGLAMLIPTLQNGVHSWINEMYYTFIIITIALCFNAMAIYRNRKASVQQLVH